MIKTDDSKNYIIIEGAKTHNLKNINLSIPKNTLTIFSGVSGSGKSTLAFDTIYAEGQRRYIESLSSYAKQFLDILDKPEVDKITGLSPAIAIEQKSTSHNRRSTVGTVTEIYDYLRLLFSRLGTPQCPQHNTLLIKNTSSQLINNILKNYKNIKIMICAPIIRGRKGEYSALINNLLNLGFMRAIINGKIVNLNDNLSLDSKSRHHISIIIDRLSINKINKSRIGEAIDKSLDIAEGNLIIYKIINDKDLNQLDPNPQTFSINKACNICGFSIESLEPQMFSFNHKGACTECNGLGISPSINPNLILDFEKSLRDNPIKPNTINKDNGILSLIIKNLTRKNIIPADLPIKKYTSQQKNTLLYGSSQYINMLGKKIANPGIIGFLIKRFNIKGYHKNLIDEALCNECQGSRLNKIASNVYINNKNIYYLCKLNLVKAKKFIEEYKKSLDKTQLVIGDKILEEIITRLNFLIKVGLDYLTLSRNASTLSGGEAQRIRLASQIGSGLTGVIYVLDEPSIGLHQKDNQKLINTLQKLKNLNNTVIVVEHDEDTIKAADYIVDIGPLAGVDGGHIIANTSNFKQLLKNKTSLTAKYLNNKNKITILPKVINTKTKFLKLTNASGNNLKNVNIAIPIGHLTCITGVSGSGKSSLISQTLYPILSQKFHKRSQSYPLSYEKIKGLEYLQQIINIDQSALGKMSRSNPATYIKLFDHIRDLFANLPLSKARGYNKSYFSSLLKKGRCENCEGYGIITIQMQFMADVYTKCPNCKGKRYKDNILEVKFEGFNISDILNITVKEALDLFKYFPKIKKYLDILKEVGLEYIKIGQNSTTLSGGEAQRIKLASELIKNQNKINNNIYILDEPTTGLHFYDLHLLLKVLQKLRDKGATIVIIEHNLDVIANSDWLIDLGPLGGEKGGNILFEGKTTDIHLAKESFTKEFLIPKLKNIKRIN